jgi:hypothetical protein
MSVHDSNVTVLLLMIAAAGCGGGQAGGYLILVELQGSTQAFASRQISLEDKDFSSPVFNSITGWQMESGGLCTLSHDEFLNHSLHVVVTSTLDGSVVNETDVPRYACKYSVDNHPDYEEDDTWFLDDDGTIEANTADLTKTGSTCYLGTASGPYLCPKPDF